MAGPLEAHSQLIFNRAEQNCITPPVEVSKCSNSIPYMERLPTEIWCQIYSLIAGKKIRIETSSIRLQYDTNRHISSRRSQCKTVLALASTCRWIYHTLIPIYYSKNTFSIPCHPQRFLTDIGPRNVNLITSIELYEWPVGYSSKSSWLQIAAMASLKEVSVRYLFSPNWFHYTHSTGEIQHVNLCAVCEYCLLIDSLSDLSHDDGDRPKRIPIPLPDDFPVLVAADVWDQCGWLECKKFGDEGFSIRTAYSWGSVRASIYDDCMAIDVERS